MATLNQASIMGFVGADPKINVTQSGRKVASFSIATTEPGYTTKDGKVIAERTEWHNIVLWGRTAEVVEKYIRKGSSVFVQGKIRTRSYQDKQGQTKYITEIEGEMMQMLDRPNSNGGGGGNATTASQQQQGGYGQGYQMPPAPAYGGGGGYNAPSYPAPGDGMGRDEDLPF